MSNQDKVVVDVREELRNGGEPFGRIMAAANQLQPGQVLELWAIFEPKPLFNVLAGLGFSHTAEPQPNGDWKVLFERQGSNGSSQQATTEAAPFPTVRKETEPEINLLAHPHGECHERVIEGLDEVGVGETALVIADHDTKPVFYMYEAQRGYALDYEYLQRGPDVWKVRVTKRPERSEEQGLETFDVRQMAPAQRHSAIHAKFDGLRPGEGFVLVNDHDPKPLYYELRSTRGDTLEWTYIEQGPAVWQVSIVKTAESSIEHGPASTTIDVRKIPHAERHHTIFHRFGTLLDGESMEIIADHDPQPLYYAFRQMQRDRFSWSYLEEGPEAWRVLITKVDPTALKAAQSASHSETPELDVRSHAPAQRHQMIFDAYDALEPGSAFVLVNDHDPRPLYYQFEAELEGRFGWEYLKSGPDEWKVMIGKTR